LICPRRALQSGALCRRVELGPVLLVGAACGGGGDDGGDGGGDAADLQAQAQEVGALLDQIEALPTTATTAQQFSTELALLRDQIQALIEQVQETSAPDELSSQKEQLSNRLRSLRTSLGRVSGLLANDDFEGAKTATEQLLAINQLRQTIAAIEAAASGR
jgi:hypothetical protein